jgi:SAM-dependent methyltransferase
VGFDLMVGTVRPMAEPAADAAERRYERELQFHDERFGNEGAVRSADRFYAVNDACERDYRGALGRTSGGARVLEYGCGTGSHAFALAAGGRIVTGIDLSPVAVAEAERQARSEAGPPDDRVGPGVLENPSFLEMNAEKLEFDDASFDLVCGSGILHHLDLVRALPEVRRVLRPGGRAVFVEPLGHNPLINLYRRFTPSIRTEDEHPLRVDDLARFGDHFGRVSVRSYAALALLAIPLRRFGSFGPVLAFLNRMDAALFRRVPYLARHGWTALIELEEPRGTD